MLTPAELPECLSEIREKACRRCRGRTAAGLPCLPDECEVPGRIPEVLQDLGERPRAVLADFLTRDRERVCDRCLLLLLLHAIGRLVPADDLPGWLDQPSVDLDGRTPRACIEAQDYDAVFRALFLGSGQRNGVCGPVS